MPSARAVKMAPAKRVHSGFPRACVTTGHRMNFVGPKDKSLIWVCSVCARIEIQPMI